MAEEARRKSGIPGRSHGESQGTAATIPARGTAPERAREQIERMDTRDVTRAIEKLKSQMKISGIGHTGCTDETKRERLDGDLSALLIVRDAEREIWDPAAAHDRADVDMPNIEDVIGLE